MRMAAETRQPWAVFLGAAAALVLVSALGVMVGGALGQYLPMIWVKRGAALLFIAIGVLVFLESL